MIWTAPTPYGEITYDSIDGSVVIGTTGRPVWNCRRSDGVPVIITTWCSMNSMSTDQLQEMLDAWFKSYQATSDDESEHKETKAKEYDQGCDHDWADYYGLRESYRYCKKCDMKEND